MLAFHNKLSIKKFYLNRVLEHQKADEIIQGTYWQNGKGCAVGCTIHDSDHLKYETELGINVILAKLQDSIFEGLPNEKAKLWPGEFLNAINVGADLSEVWTKFAIWLLVDETHGVIKYVEDRKPRKFIQSVADYIHSRKGSLSELKNTLDYHVPGHSYSLMTAISASCSYEYGHIFYVGSDAANASEYAADAAAYFPSDYYNHESHRLTKEKARIFQADKLLELMRECN